MTQHEIDLTIRDLAFLGHPNTEISRRGPARGHAQQEHALSIDSG